MPRAPYSDRLKKNVLSLTRKRSWTLEKLALEAEVSKGQLSLIVAGKRTPRVGTLKKLADALGADILDLFAK